MMKIKLIKSLMIAIPVLVVSCSNPQYQLEKGKEVVAVDSRYFRPTEVDSLIGSFKKAKKLLNWKPKISLNNIIKEMVDSELKELNK